MTILIKGMEMPKICSACRFAGYGGRFCELHVCMFTGESQPTLSPERMSNCPLIEVPTPHGRLIDADAMAGDDNEAYKTAQLALMGAGSGAGAMRMVYEIAHKNFQMHIADAPTVIEAEG